MTTQLTSTPKGGGLARAKSAAGYITLFAAGMLIVSVNASSAIAANESNDWQGEQPIVGTSSDGPHAQEPSTGASSDGPHLQEPSTGASSDGPHFAPANYTSDFDITIGEGEGSGGNLPMWATSGGTFDPNDGSISSSGSGGSLSGVHVKPADDGTLGSAPTLILESGGSYNSEDIFFDLPVRDSNKPADDGSSWAVTPAPSGGGVHDTTTFDLSDLEQLIESLDLTVVVNGDVTVNIYIDGSVA